MNNIKTIKVRAEGTINCFWFVTLNDGTVLEYWSCDQESPVDCSNDTKLYDSDPELAQFLQELWYGMPVDDEDTEATTYLFNNKGKVIQILP